MLRLLTLLLTITAAYAQGLIINPFFVADPCVSCTQYTNANTATFAGGTAMIYRTSALAALADSKMFTVSFWLNVTNGGTIFDLNDNTSMRFRLSIGSGRLDITGRNAAGSTILGASSPNSAISSSAWNHVFLCVDLANSTKRHLYVNGVELSATWSTYTNDTIDFATETPNTAFGNGYASQNSGYQGALAEFWFDDVYVDQVCYFYCSTHPSDVGATGQLPTNSAPSIYLSRVGSAQSWRNDSSGNSNNFLSQVGTLGSTTPP